MDFLLQDEKKIEKFEQIQRNLISLDPNAGDEEINEFIKQIPKEFLTQKDELKVICRLFAIYSRIRHLSRKRNMFKLFELIMTSLQTYLNDESYFLWKIFGGLNYFRLFMHERGLITIETIISEAKKDEEHCISEYFLPEIKEENPELFEKEIKYRLECPYSKEYIEEFKELRSKYLKWICDSCDFKDPLFKEIETDQLRYSILTDDVDSFQRIISQSNLDLNSKIKLSLVQNTRCSYSELSLFEIAMDFNSINICKFLILNKAKFDKELYYSAINSNNYEMIHFLESYFSDDFSKYTMFYSVSNWKNDITEYILDNYDDFKGLDNDSEIEIETEQKNNIIEVIAYMLIYLNFQFLREKLIPFFIKNPKFLSDFKNEIAGFSICDNTGYFAKLFLKNPEIDINFLSKENYTLIGYAIEYANYNAFDLIVKNENFLINKSCFKSFPPLIYACGIFADMKIVKMLCNLPSMNINLRDERHSLNAFEMSISRGNFYASEYLIENFNDLSVQNYGCFFSYGLQKRNYKMLEILMLHHLKTSKDTMFETIEKNTIRYLLHNEHKDEYLADLRKIYDLSFSTLNK